MQQPNAFHTLHARLSELIAATLERRAFDESRVPALALRVMGEENSILNGGKHLVKLMARDSIAKFMARRSRKRERSEPSE